MNWFKRLCLFVFGVSGILSLVALSLVWVGPWTTQARTLITENRPYFITLEVLVCIAAAGLLICVLKSLFTPRNPKESIVVELDGGHITVTRQAIVAQTKHIIEADGTCTPLSVRVRLRKRGNVRVHARVRPNAPLDVVERGALLHTELEQGLAKVCGDSVRSIDILFTNPEQAGELSSYVDDKTAEAAAEVPAQVAPEQEERVGSFTLRVEGKDVAMNPHAEVSYPAAPNLVDNSEQGATSEIVSQPDASPAADAATEGEV